MGTVYESQVKGFAGRTCSGAELNLAIADEVVIGGHKLPANGLPAGLAISEAAGVVTPAGLTPRRIHGWPKPYDFSEAPRVCVTPGGDLLMMCVTGIGHQWGVSEKRNEIVAYRSQDNGTTWSGPTSPWSVPYNEHAFNPLIPRGEGRRIVAFMSDFHPDTLCLPHTGVLGIRTSDDDGHTWSDVRRVTPVNDPGMRGVFHMQGCETDTGAWLLGTYTISNGGPEGRVDHQYVMRSTDQGETWHLLPGPRPAGWRLEPWQRLLEGRIIRADAGEYLMLTRTLEGHLFAQRSTDDGCTWSDPAPTPLVHPDAPPMVWNLSDGKTLLALVHNKPGGNCKGRDELWCCLSRDGGRTWSEPRFLLANAAVDCPPEGLAWMSGNATNMEVCYADLVVRDGILHLFYNHAKRHVHYLQIPESRLESLPTARELGL